MILLDRVLEFHSNYKKLHVKFPSAWMYICFCLCVYVGKFREREREKIIQTGPLKTNLWLMCVLVPSSEFGVWGIKMFLDSRPCVYSVDKCVEKKEENFPIP